MAVGANTYGTVARVQGYVGDIADGRIFTNETIPTLEEVEAYLDDVAAIINMELEQSGYTVPVAVANDAQAHAYLLLANSAGAAAMALSSMPTEAYSDTEEGQQLARSRRQYLQGILNNCIKLIRERRLPAARSSVTNQLFAGSQQDSDGAVKKPLFKRDTMDYPGRRTLTEP